MNEEFNEHHVMCNRVRVLRVVDDEGEEDEVEGHRQPLGIKPSQILLVKTLQQKTM